MDQLKKIMDLCSKYISYDPNYNYDDEDADGVKDSMEQDDNDIDEKCFKTNIFEIQI